MTDNTTDPFSAECDQIIADGLSAVQRMRDHIAAIEKAKLSQPERLAKARSDAEEARGWALLEEPLDSQIGELAALNTDDWVKLPNMVAKELWGARLAFDLLDCGDDYEQIDAVTARLFAAAGGDPGVTMVIQAAALSTIASLIVPELLSEIEHTGSNYDQRVRLCEARAKAWHGRANKLREANEDATANGVKPIDGFDIGAQAFDDEDGPL